MYLIKYNIIVTIKRNSITLNYKEVKKKTTRQRFSFNHVISFIFHFFFFILQSIDWFPDGYNPPHFELF